MQRTEPLYIRYAIAEYAKIRAKYRPDNTDGGPGSGNWGHEGVKGQRGGSAPSGGKNDAKAISRISRSEAWNDWASADEEDRLAYLDDMRETYPDYGHTRNGTLANAIAFHEGINAKPTSLSEKDFEEYVKETGCKKIYRGVENFEDEDGDVLSTGADIRKEFATAEDSTYGGGNYGSGYHFSDSENVAKGFAHKSNGGEVFECAIKPTARLMNNTEWESLPSSAKKQYDNDEGLYAITHGYDGISSNTGVTNIVNRGALVYKEPAKN